MSESTELATIEEQGGADVVTVQVLDAKTGQMVPARIPAELAERFPAYGNVEEMAELTAEVFGDNGGTMSIGDLVRVKVPSGDSIAFTLGDQAPKTFDCIMILRQERRNYWEKSVEEEGNQPPDCFSRDGVHGVGRYGPGTDQNPSGMCEPCPMSQWAEVDGKRVPPPCHQQEAVLALIEGMAFPLLLTVPRTSIKNFREYWKRTLFVGKMKSLIEVVTTVGLSPTKNDQGTKYNELTFTLKEDLTKGMSREEKNSYKRVPLSLAEQFRKILVNVDTSHDTDGATSATGNGIDGEGGFTFQDEPAEEYAGQRVE